jgi:hypothetical protein
MSSLEWFYPGFLVLGSGFLLLVCFRPDEGSKPNDELSCTSIFSCTFEVSFSYFEACFSDRS